MGGNSGNYVGPWRRKSMEMIKEFERSGSMCLTMNGTANSREQ